MEVIKDGFVITTDKRKVDLQYVHSFLSASYWAENIPLEVVRKSIEGSLCFIVLKKDRQVGFARIITDGATFAYLADVFIDKDEQGKGLGKWLVATILQHPSLQGLRRVLLATRDAHGLYTKLAFKAIPNPESWMQIHNPGVYKSNK